MQEQTPHPSLPVSLGIIFIGFLLAGFVSFLTPTLLSSFQLLVVEWTIIVPALFYVSRKKHNWRAVFRINGIEKPVVWVSIALSLSITVLMDEVDRIIQTFIKVPPEFEELISVTFKVDSFADGLTLFCGAVVLAGIIEEMLFRGLLLKSLEKRFDLTQAMFFSALAFAFFHPLWLIQTLILGLILGFLAWRSNSIVPSIILHASNNAVALLLVNMKTEHLNWYNWNDHVYPPIVVVAAGITFYGFKWFYRLTGDKEVEST